MMATDMIRELFSLEGRVALVTGASSGIGRELAQGLAASGAKVALSGRSKERLEATKKTIIDQGGEAEAFPAELGELEAVQPLVDAVVGHFGQIDILLN